MTDHPGAPFYRIGPEQPAGPVVLSVPHAGRAYSAALLRSARVPTSILETLEDRLVDRLVWRAVANGATAIVATAPRAEIDLNRDEREIDPLMVAPSPPASAILHTVRMRGGLGLVPARLAGAGGLWRARISRAELDRRIETIHRAYHHALAEALQSAHRQFGVAVLLDCHSMPPRPSGVGNAGIVFGDRHGLTAGDDLRTAAIRAAQRLGYSTACNDPYAGGHIVERHGRPADGIHAIQIELDRALYLDAGLRTPGPRFDFVAQLLAAVSAALADAALPSAIAIAAE